MPGKAIDIAVDIKKNEVYVIGTSKKIFKYNRNSKKWIPLKGTRNDFTKMAVHDGKIWGVTTGKKIYSYNPNSTVIPLPSNSSITVNNNSTKNYEGTYRFTMTRILTYAPEQQLIKKGIDIYGTAGIYLNAKNRNESVKINPLNRKKNRMLDISKGNTEHIKSKYWNKPRSVTIDVNGVAKNFNYYGEYLSLIHI